MQRLEVSGAVRPLYGSLGVKGLINQSCGSYDNHPVNTTSWHANGKSHAFLSSQQATAQYHDITATTETFGNVTVPLRLSSFNNQHSWSAQLNVAQYWMICVQCVYTKDIYRKHIRAVKTLELSIPTNIQFLHALCA